MDDRFQILMNLLINGWARVRITFMKIICLLWMCFGLVNVFAADELRVASYNIHHGQGMDGKLDLKRIAEALKKHQPDFVALQEVDNMAARTGKVDQAAELAKILGMKSVFRKSINIGKGGYGNAVLSKYPILETHLHKLPGPGEARTALEVVCEVNGKKLSFISVHLDHQVESTRVGQVKALDKALASRKHPVMIIGDLNAEPDSESMKWLAQTWSFIPKSGVVGSFPANKPSIEIDHIVTRGFTTEKSTSYVGKENVASDHRPVFGVVVWK